MEAVIDTNCLIFDMVKDSEFHVSARKLLDRTDRWIVPSVVVEEFVFALKQLGVGDDLIAREVEEFLASGKAVFEPVRLQDVKAALDLIKAEGISSKRFNDKLILSIAKRDGAAVMTFDKGLQTECRSQGVEVVT